MVAKIWKSSQKFHCKFYTNQRPFYIGFYLLYQKSWIQKDPQIIILFLQKWCLPASVPAYLGGGTLIGIDGEHWWTNSSSNLALFNFSLFCPMLKMGMHLSPPICHFKSNLPPKEMNMFHIKVSCSIILKTLMVDGMKHYTNKVPGELPSSLLKHCIIQCTC